ncbi:hypothetical protein FGLOB1_125 [Fusarium globosum]|uniref:Uncharacterized protein n=1 Tax=Fusarium globosum TaxID=78864 RepID=A0A8H6DLB9_9HYPO|nr:hypothetical protein FGLOB1_125 [Fusarium globosum]
MAIQEEKSRKRKSGEAQLEAATDGVRKPRFRDSLRLRPMRINKLSSRKPTVNPHYSEDEDDAATLKLETDAPVSPASAPKERRLNRASDTAGTASTADTTPLCLPGTKVSKCAGCGSPSHRLNICMKAGLLDGLIKGCPWCNTLEHSLANCPETKHDLAMQLEVIQMRANMPSFQPTQDWVDIIRVAVANGHKPPNGFPWTPQFTKTLRGSLSLYQRGLDRVGFNNRKGLPIDPDTKDWETVQRKFPPFEGY